MKKITVLILIVTSLTLPVWVYSAPEDGNSGVIYGDHHAFVLTAPEGWVLDNSSGVNQGLHAVFYPQGSSWALSPVVMYANTCVCKKKGETLQDFMDQELEIFKKSGSGNVKAVKVEAIHLKGDRKAQIRHLTGDQYGNYESIAYIEENKVFIMLVLSTKSQKGFEDSLPAFRKLVESYNFISEEVRIKK